MKKIFSTLVIVLLGLSLFAQTEGRVISTPSVGGGGGGAADGVTTGATYDPVTGN